MGRSPCCEKVGLKKGPWTPEEDKMLLAYIDKHGLGSWRALPSKAGLQRCGKSCRLRWTNYLRPDIKRGKFSQQEEQTIIQLHALLGNRWSTIATHLPKRTDNEIKNYWNTRLKKKLVKMGIDPVTHKPKNDTLLSADSHSKAIANLNHMAQWESARLEAEARQVKQSTLNPTQLPLHGALVSSPVMPWRCLDILKVWNGEWEGSKVTKSCGKVFGQEQESPSLTFSTTHIGANNSGSLEEVWKSFGSTTRFPVIGMTEDSIKSKDSNEQVQTSIFLENFTDLLYNNNCDGGTRSGKMAEVGGAMYIDESGGCGGGVEPGGGGYGGPYYDETCKNYWNCILHMVNSPWSSDAPDIF